MVGSDDLDNLLKKVLHDAANKLNLHKYSLNLDLNPLKGDGFLGEFYEVSITDDKTHAIYHLVAKKAPEERTYREQNHMEWVYKNEILFYSEIYPAFRRFEQEHHVEQPFVSLPEYITTNSEIGNEIIVLKDLIKEGYILREKTLLMDDEHIKLVLKAYGHYHALSFCMRQQKPEEFERLTKPITNVWKKMTDNGPFINILIKMQNKAYECLDSSKDALIMDKFIKYKNNPRQIFKESTEYQGEYFGILHGDGWSNNMMFKYEDPQKLSKLESMKLLDFQLLMSGTPVQDLSYFLYTAGSKELFDKLEDYLDIYYESFSTAARNLGGDPNKLLPRETLTQDWKEYARFGMMVATVVTKIKLISKEDTIEVVENAENKPETNDNGEAFMAIKYDEKLYKKRVREIIVHMYEMDAL